MTTRTKTRPLAPGQKTELIVRCPAFGRLQPVPKQYTCDGANINPQLDIRLLPSTAKSLAVIVSDKDSFVPGWIHWVIWDIPVTHHILEGHTKGVEGVNDFHETGYKGPCPPNGTHHYHFTVYALDRILGLPAHTDARQLEKAMEGHVVAWGETVGTYRRV
ncbi:MAG TPA: YbhB/YbcL family Raf kinase inhibitor-like protein [Puia sp.]|nr:YbhB/YbcL family Raf kinase inhibitor-like protein [Puia sp.]